MIRPVSPSFIGFMCLLRMLTPSTVTLPFLRSTLMTCVRRAAQTLKIARGASARARSAAAGRASSCVAARTFPTAPLSAPVITCTLSPVRNAAMPIESDAAPLRVTTRGEPTTRAEAVLNMSASARRNLSTIVGSAATEERGA